MIKLPGTKEKANLYVTRLVEIMFNMEQLVALQPADTYNDEKYKYIKGNETFFLLIIIFSFILSFQKRFVSNSG